MSKASVVIVKLDHGEWEKKVDSIICDLVDDTIFLFIESSQGPKCHEGAIYEAPIFMILQFIVSFLPSINNPIFAKRFSVGHADTKQLGRLDSRLPAKFFITGLAVSVLDFINKPQSRRDLGLYNEGQGSLFYTELLNALNGYSTLDALRKIKEWRDNPEVFDYYINLGNHASRLFLNFLEETGTIPLDVQEIYDLLEAMTPENPNIEEDFMSLREMVVDIRDEMTVKHVENLAKEGKYHKFVLLVGSNHAKGIANRLDEDDFHIEIVEKNDLDNLLYQMERLREML